MRRTALRYSVTGIALAILLFVGPSHLQAADTNDDFGGDQHCLCFRGAPQAQCKNFFITETGLRFNFDRDRSGDKGALITDLGWMRNISLKDAIGVSLYQAFDGNSYRVGIRPRYRRWLHPDYAVDVSAGVLLYAEGVDWFESWGSTDTEADGPGLIASVSVTAFDILAVTLQYERFTVTQYSSNYLLDGEPIPLWTDRDDMYFGLTLGSYPGTPFVVAGTVLSMLAIFDSD